MAASELPKLYQGVQKGSFGYKMLATMGWSEGQGLGANNQGIKEHIKVKKKQDAFGVGAAEQAHKLRDWTTGMVGYDAILSGLKEITRGPGGSSSSSSSDDDSDSSGGHTSGYDSDSDTSGDAAAARKAKKSKKGTKQSSKKVKSKKGSKGDRDSSEKTKKRKQGQEDDAAAAGKAGKRAKTGKKAAADSSSADNSSSGSGSDSDSEPAAAVPAATLAKVSRVKAATHVGRYAKRERAKTVRNYSASDLAAILGLPSSAPAVEGGEGADAWAAAAAAAAGGGNAHQAGSSSSSGSDSSSSDDDSDNSSDSGRQGSEQRLRPGTPPGSDTPPSRSQQGFEADEAAAKPSGAPEADAAAANAWWRNLFVKSGGSGSSIGMRPAAKSINAHGFLEDDQTNLYMQAHATATTGKQGLGRSSMPKKVAGARWQGTKTKLGSDDEDDEQAAQQQQQHEAAVDSIAAAAAAAGREQYVKNGILIVLPKKRDAAQQQQQESQQQEQPKKEKKSKKSKKAAAAAAAAAAAEESSVGKKRKHPQDLAAAAATEQGGSSKKSKQQAAAAAAAADAQPAGTTAAAAAAAAGGGVSDAHKSVKWAKLAAKILAGAPKRRMRIQKLHKQVVAAAGYDVAAASAADTEALYQQMLRKLQKAEGLQVCDKYVGLASA